MDDMKRSRRSSQSPSYDWFKKYAEKGYFLEQKPNATRLLMSKADAQAIEKQAWATVASAKDNPRCCKKVMQVGGRNMIVIFGRVSLQKNRQISFFCKKCKKNVERVMTAREYDLFRQVDQAGDVANSAIHNLWHTFSKIFRDREDSKWKWSGWDMMVRVKKLLPSKLKGVITLRCDDSVHANSDLLLIPHATYWKGRLDYYWGTTVVYIPQCSGEQPISFFFYGSHLKRIVPMLTKISKLHASHGERW